MSQSYGKEVACVQSTFSPGEALVPPPVGGVTVVLKVEPTVHWEIILKASRRGKTSEKKLHWQAKPMW